MLFRRMNAFVGYLFVVIWIANDSVCSSQERSPVSPATSHFKAVDALLQSHVERNQIAGATAIVMHRGNVVYQNQIGFQDIEQKTPMVQNTLFRIASMTKPITSAAIMMLVDEGKITLKTQLAEIIPEFKDLQVQTFGLADPKEPSLAKVSRPITLHDLLTHRSGLTYGFSLPENAAKEFADAGICDGLQESPLSLAQNVQRLAKMPLVKQPGTEWNYGLSTDVLGRVIEVVSGMSLDSFLRSRIFEPLGMNDTFFVVPKDKLSRLATLYRSDSVQGVVPIEKGPQRSGLIAYSSTFQLPDASNYRSGGAGLVSTASDYAKFLSMLLLKGRVGDKQLLKSETVALMTRNQIDDQTIAFPIHGDKFGYGFGIHQDSKDRNGSAVGTYSWAGIFHSYFWVDPQQEVVAVLMTQLFPAEGINLWATFQQTVNAAIAASAVAVAAADPNEPKTKKLFNGTSLEGWDGDKRFWRVEEGAIVGETTESNKAEKNTFLIYRKEEFSDFELRFEYQVKGFNSGIQYRSVDQGDFVVKGYQADFEDRWHKSDAGLIDKFSGMFFEENGRMFMGQRGQSVLVRNNPDAPKKPIIEVTGSIGKAETLEQSIHRDGWNQYHVIARGFTFEHIINGQLMSVALDEDQENRKASGIFAFQLHSGTPMSIRVKNIEVQPLPK